MWFHRRLTTTQCWRKRQVLYSPLFPQCCTNSGTSVQSINLKIGKKNVAKQIFKMIKGQTEQLKVTVKPASSKKAVTYVSKNSKIVSVSKKGKLTAKGTGMAQVVVKVAGKDGATKKTWVKIKVSNKKSETDTTDETDPGNTDIPDNPGTPNVPNTPGTPGTTGGGGSTGYLPSSSSNSSTVIQNLLAQLRKQPTEVLFKTNEKINNLVIPAGTYKNTVLIVDAPNATITNEAVYKRIEIRVISSHT